MREELNSPQRAPFDFAQGRLRNTENYGKRKEL